MKKEIFVTYQLEGFHAWPDAPDEVSFLRARHRHIFHFKVGMPVRHNDRDREFFIEKRKLIEVVLDHFTKNHLNVGSCEMIAEHILNTLPHVRWVQVEEDGENGARLERD